MANRRRFDLPQQLEGDWYGVVRGRGCPPPQSSAPLRPIRIHFDDVEFEDRVRKR